MRRFSGHRQILQVKDSEADRASGRVVMLLELAECDLHKFLENENFALDAFTMSRLAFCLADCVQACHDRGVIHFDLKLQNFLVVRDQEKLRTASCEETKCQQDKTEVPRNVLQSPPSAVFLGKYRLKLADFGLAHRLPESKTHLSGFGMHGTILYMAPETIYQPSEDGRKKMGGQVDVWALGVILYQLLHRGATPWDRHRRLGRVGVSVTIANPHHVVKFERAVAWQQQKDLFHHAVLGENHESGPNSASTSASAASRQLRDNKSAAQPPILPPGRSPPGVEVAAPPAVVTETDAAPPTCDDARPPSAAVSLVLRTAVCELRQALTDKKGGPTTVRAVLACRGTIAHLHLTLELLFRICERCLEFNASKRLNSAELSRWCADAVGFRAGEFVEAVLLARLEDVVFCGTTTSVSPRDAVLDALAGAVFPGTPQTPALSAVCLDHDCEPVGADGIAARAETEAEAEARREEGPVKGSRAGGVSWLWHVLGPLACIAGLGMIVGAVVSSMGKNDAATSGGVEVVTPLPTTISLVAERAESSSPPKAPKDDDGVVFSTWPAAKGVASTVLDATEIPAISSAAPSGFLPSYDGRNPPEALQRTLAANPTSGGGMAASIPSPLVVIPTSVVSSPPSKDPSDPPVSKVASVLSNPSDATSDLTNALPFLSSANSLTPGQTQTPGGEVSQKSPPAVPASVLNIEAVRAQCDTVVGNLLDDAEIINHVLIRHRQNFGWGAEDIRINGKAIAKPFLRLLCLECALQLRRDECSAVDHTTDDDVFSRIVERLQESPAPQEQRQCRSRLPSHQEPVVDEIDDSEELWAEFEADLSAQQVAMARQARLIIPEHLRGKDNLVVKFQHFLEPISSQAK